MPEWYRAFAVTAIGHVPGAALNGLLDEFLASDDVLLQEAALAGLAWSDRPDLVLPVLLAHAGDDRARVAMYAASPGCSVCSAESASGVARAGTYR